MVRAATQAEKPQAVKDAIAAVAPLPPVPIQTDEYGDRVRDGWVLGWWEQARDTA